MTKCSECDQCGINGGHFDPLPIVLLAMAIGTLLGAALAFWSLEML